MLSGFLGEYFIGESFVGPYVPPIRTQVSGLPGTIMKPRAVVEPIRLTGAQSFAYSGFVTLIEVVMVSGAESGAVAGLTGWPSIITGSWATGSAIGVVVCRPIKNLTNEQMEEFLATI